jgi:hypothetical protein
MRSSSSCARLENPSRALLLHLGQVSQVEEEPRSLSGFRARSTRTSTLAASATPCRSRDPRRSQRPRQATRTTPSEPRRRAYAATAATRSPRSRSLLPERLALTSSPSWPAASLSASFEPASSPCSSSCSCPWSPRPDLLVVASEPSAAAQDAHHHLTTPVSLHLRRGSAGRIDALPSSSTSTTKRPGSAPLVKRFRPFGRCEMIAWVSVRVSIT